MLIQDLAEFLVSKNLGTFNISGSGGSIYLALQPNEPDDCVTLFDTGGTGSVFGLPDSRRAVQILVRAKLMNNAYTKAWAIYDEFITNIVNDGHFLRFNNRKMIVSATSTPLNIGKDDKGRHEFSLNLTFWTMGA